MKKHKKFAESEKVRVKTYNRFGEVNAIGTIEQVVYKMKDGQDTDEVDYYIMEIDGEDGIIIYPYEIEWKVKKAKYNK